MSPTATALVSPTVDFRMLPLTGLFPSRLNPRKTINEVALKELSESILEKGVIEPLVVRAQPSDGRFEIVAGERRYHAASAAGLDLVPCVVRELTDAEVVEHALTENHQRADVHPLEEAEAIQQLLDLDRAYTIDGLAAKLGVSKSWVYGRLKLLRMSENARAAYRADAITAEHADILSRVPPHQQDGSLTACFSEMLFYSGLNDVEDAASANSDAAAIDTMPNEVNEAIERGRWDLLAPCLESAGTLKRWVARHTVADVSDEAVQESIPELDVVIADAAAEDKALLQLSLDPSLTEGQAKTLGVIRHARWVEIVEGKAPKNGRGADGAHVSNKRCEFQRSGAITHPADPKLWRAVPTACTKRNCPIHRPAPKVTAATGGSAKRIEEEREEREKEQRNRQAREEAAKIWREEQAPKYLAELKARVMKATVVTPAIVKATVNNWDLDNIKRNFRVSLTPATALPVLLLSLMPAVHYNRDSDDAKAFGAAFGLTPDQWEKEQKATVKESKPTNSTKKTATAKSKAKKGGR